MNAKFMDTFGVFDLHMHPTLKTFMLGRHFSRRHYPPGFWFPLTLRSDVHSLIAGGVRAFLCATYIVENEFLSDAWPLRGVRCILPRVNHVFSGAPDVLAMECMDHQEAIFNEVNQKFGLTIETAKSYTDMQRIIREGRIAVLNSLEGAHHLNGKLENVEVFYDRGVCHMVIAHLYPNEACWNVDSFVALKPLQKIGCFKQTICLDTGLTDFGRELVDRMWDMGMIVDMTHATPKCRREILERGRAHPKKRPVIMSHVGVHELSPYNMNPEPDEIRAIADSGGVIGMISMSFWLRRPEHRDGIRLILETIDHLVKHGGDEVVAFGSDFDGFTAPPPNFKSPRDYVRIREAVIRKYGEQRAACFLNGNAERVIRLGWGKQ